MRNQMTSYKTIYDTSYIGTLVVFKRAELYTWYRLFTRTLISRHFDKISHPLFHLFENRVNTVREGSRFNPFYGKQHLVRGWRWVRVNNLRAKSEGTSLMFMVSILHTVARERYLLYIFPRWWKGDKDAKRRFSLAIYSIGKFRSWKGKKGKVRDIGNGKRGYSSVLREQGRGNVDMEWGVKRESWKWQWGVGMADVPSQ